MAFDDRFRVRRPGQAGRFEEDEGYESFDATALYCPKCRTAMPVRKKLLLILPDGDMYDLLCISCGASLGKKIE